MMSRSLGLVDQGHRQVLDRDPRRPGGVDQQLVSAHAIAAGPFAGLQLGRRAEVDPIDAPLTLADRELLGARQRRGARRRREIARALEAPRDQAFCLLAELRLMANATEANERRAEVIVDEVESIDQQAREAGCLVDDQWEPNSCYTGAPELVWGLVEGCDMRPRETELLPIWIDLLRSWSPALPWVVAFRRRLLREGQRWSAKPRRLS